MRNSSQQTLTLPDSIFAEQSYPHFIKYMGSKSKIMGFVLEGINEVYSGGAVCDLFAGSASIAGAIRSQAPIHSNDIQSYSAILAETYLNSHASPQLPSSSEILEAAEKCVLKNRHFIGAAVDYGKISSLEEFNIAEKLQQGLIKKDFNGSWHLFAKYYSGTWWSAEQCLWIDAIREVASTLEGQPSYALIISTLMYAMAYTSQGTGHYAQYRDATTQSSMKDILIYRKRSVASYFRRKFDAATVALPSHPPTVHHKITTLDFRDCLTEFAGGTVYADPPYCFVHYSRFYHAIETLVLYDYPNIQIKGGKIVKGRYRENRHQSPFCIKSQVIQAFSDLFEGVNRTGSNLVLSYSNTGMITIDEVGALAKAHFPQKKHKRANHGSSAHDSRTPE